LLLRQQQLFWYLAMVSLEDEETQLKGSILIYYAMRTGNQTYSRTSVSKMTWMTRAIPLRIVAAHACSDNPVFRPFLDLAAFIMENTIRVQMRHHFGNYEKQFDAPKT
jgi:hypothetical protein